MCNSNINVAAAKEGMKIECHFSVTFEAHLKPNSIRIGDLFPGVFEVNSAETNRPVKWLKVKEI